VARLPRALYRVEIEGRRHVVAHVADDVRRNFVRLVEGDRVVVELAPHDRTRGRITRRVA
jgi:translation initiation factor IF-1